MKVFRFFIMMFLFFAGCGHLDNAGKFYQSGDYDQTLAVCRSAIAENPDDTAAWLWMARAFCAMDSLPQCQETLDHLTNSESRTAKLSSEISAVWVDLGKKTGESDKALQAFETAVRIDSSNTAALDTLAQIYEHNGRNKDAARMYNRLILLVEDAGVYMTRVNAIENRRAFSEGEYRKGMRALKAGLVDKAEEHFGKASEADPNHAEAVFQYNYLKGKRLFESAYKSNMDEAVKAFERAALAKPSDAGIHYLLGKASERAGKNYLDTAIRAYQDYLKVSPEGKYAKTCRKKIKTLKQQKAFWNKG